jgi:hypothetical protein
VEQPGLAIRRADADDHRLVGQRQSARHDGSINFSVGILRRLVPPLRDLVKDRNQDRAAADGAIVGRHHRNVAPIGQLNIGGALVVLNARPQRGDLVEISASILKNDRCLFAIGRQTGTQRPLAGTQLALTFEPSRRLGQDQGCN